MRRSYKRKRKEDRRRVEGLEMEWEEANGVEEEGVRTGDVLVEEAVEDEGEFALVPAGVVGLTLKSTVEHSDSVTELAHAQLGHGSDLNTLVLGEVEEERGGRG